VAAARDEIDPSLDHIIGERHQSRRHGRRDQQLRAIVLCFDAIVDAVSLPG